MTTHKARWPDPSQLNLKGERVEKQYPSTPTRPEKILKLILDTLEIDYIREPRLPGTPDFLIPHTKTVIFVDGDFWHGRHIDALKQRLAKLGKLGKLGEIPTEIKERTEWIRQYEKLTYWITKLENTGRHDQAVTWHLEKMGYDVRRIWASELGD